MDLILTSYSIKRLIYLVLSTIIAFTILNLFNNPQAYWLLWTVFTLSLFTFTATFMQRIFTIFITGYLAALAAFAAGKLYPYPWALYTYLFLLISFCAFISQYFPKKWLPLFIISLFAILGTALAPSYLENSARFNYMMIGMLLTILLQAIFWPWYGTTEMNYTITQSKHQLKELNKEIFSCFLEPDYGSNIYLYERRIHLQKNNFLQWLQRLRALNTQAMTSSSLKKIESQEALLTRLDQLYDLTLDYSLLRTRVTDYSTFEVCKKEMSALLAAIENVYQAWISRKEIQTKLQAFAQAIQEFEENFQTILNVTAREPLVFLLFIASMKKLHQRLGEP